LANKKSALKAMRVSERRRARNKPVRSAVKTYFKNAERAINDGDADRAQEAARTAASNIDKAVNKGVIHRNAAARRKSRLMKKLNAALAAG
jgi:small subunit ribosomal protein S20